MSILNLLVVIIVKEYKQHRLSAIYPRMEDATFDSLCESIRINGFDQHHEIVLFDGEILDGWHRYKACEKVGIDATFRSFDGSTRDAIKFVQRENFDRRDLTSSDRAYIAASMKTLIDSLMADAKNRQGGGQTELTKSLDNSTTDVHTRQTDSILASKTGTNRQYVSDARKLMRDSPKVFNAAKELKISIPDAKKIAKLEPETQTKVIEEIKNDPKIIPKKAIQAAKKEQKREAIDEAIKEIKAQPQDDDVLELNTVRVADVATLDLPECSVDMIFTDPPYSPDYHEEYKHLSRLAGTVLKDGAYCCVYCGKMFLPEIMSIMGEHLEYVWTCAIHLPGNHVKINKHNLFEDWRTIIVYKKSGKTVSRRWVSDFIRNTKEKGLHEWQQGQDAPMQYIDAYTEPLDIVLDPFVGSGTVPVVCKKLGRQYIAFDKDERAVKITLRRLEDGS